MEYAANTDTLMAVFPRTVFISEHCPLQRMVEIPYDGQAER